ncbi:MAG: nitroreductase family deazaflavin-dependent oxidoreductase [Anaerolineales bacterium]|jgi:deazaflavin-dependent oxidoreductase (nitroreductase family)
MPTKIKEVQPPRGLNRILYRLPILLYRLRLGWLLGDRFLLLIHTGRVSGAPRQTVLEIIRHDKKGDAYVVVSAWGEKSDWYRNIKKTPQVIVQVGRKRVEAVAERLSQEDAEREILDYARRYPRLLRALARLMGYQLEDSEQDYRALARLVPVVAFRPKRT